MKTIFLKYAGFLLAIAVFTVGCDNKTNIVDEPEGKEIFCSYLNEENIDKTIPIVDQYLSGLSSALNIEQQLKDLTAWFKSCPCISEVAALTLPNQQNDPREIAFSFDENGITKEYIFEISMSQPLSVISLREKFFYEEFYASKYLCQWANFGIPSSDATVMINSNSELERYLVRTGANYPKIDFTKRTLLLAWGKAENDISEITGSVQQLSANECKVDIEVTSVNVPYMQRWVKAFITSKLRNESRIELNVTRTSEELPEIYYYASGEKIYPQQVTDKIYLRFTSEATKEQLLAIIGSNTYLQVYSSHFDEGFRQSAVLVSKDGNRVPLLAIQYFKEREEVISAEYLLQSNAAITDEFMVTLKETTSYKQLQTLAEKNNCKVGEELKFLKNTYMMYVSKASKLNAIQMSSLFYETGLFDITSPNFIKLNSFYTN